MRPTTALAAAAALTAAGLASADAVPARVDAPPAGVVQTVVDRGGTERARAQADLEPAGAPASSVRYRWPTELPGVVARGFVGPAERWTSGHRGVDLALDPGSSVLAAADGVVAFAGPLAGRPVLSVQHRDGIRTTYEPVSAVVRAGDVVRAGQLVGHLASDGSHCDPGSCLHWGARRGRDDYLDPLTLIARDVVIRLFPAD